MKPITPAMLGVFALVALACGSPTPRDSAADDSDTSVAPDIASCLATYVRPWERPAFEEWRAWPAAEGGWTSHGTNMFCAAALSEEGTLYAEFATTSHPAAIRSFRPADAALTSLYFTWHACEFVVAVDDLGRAWHVSPTEERVIERDVRWFLAESAQGSLFWLGTDGAAHVRNRGGGHELAWVDAIRQVPIRQVIAPMPIGGASASVLLPGLDECVPRAVFFCLLYEDDVLECYGGGEGSPETWGACGRLEDVHLVTEGSAPMCALFNTGYASCANQVPGLHEPFHADLVSIASGPEGRGLVGVTSDGAVHFWPEPEWRAEPLVAHYGNPPPGVRWKSVRMDDNSSAPNALSLMAEDGTIWLSPASSVGCETGTGVPLSELDDTP